MWKVLIADDEPRVGQLVKALIRWEELDLELVGICQDGKTAWDLISREKPDIVITDIRMPVVSGLELVQRSAEEKLPVRFVIISGYRYFEYAHKALQFGVEDYLLKPIEEDKLNETLKNICDALIAKGEVDRMQSDLSANRRVLNESFLREAAAAEADPGVIKDLLDKYSLKWNGDLLSAFHIRVDRAAGVPKSHLQEKGISEDMLDIVEKEALRCGIDIAAAAEGGLDFPILVSWSSDQREEVRRLSHDIMKRLREYFSSYRDYVPTLGLSDLNNGSKDPARALSEARLAAGQRLIAGVNRRIKAVDIPAASVSFDELIGRYGEDFRAAAEIMNTDDAERAVRACFRDAAAGMSPGNTYYELCKAFLDILITQSGGSDEGRLSEWYEELQNITDREKLKRALMDRTEQYMEAYRLAKEKENSKPIRETLRYMEQHYDEKLQLEDFAEKYYFNTSYFSELFKKETGKNFSDCLTEIRMNAAKELLRNTRDPMHILAMKVGYKDAKYFSQQFTKLVGIKPTEYRRLYQ